MSKEGIDMESPEYKAGALATAKQASGNDNDGLFGGVVRFIFIGRYAIMGPRTPDSQNGVSTKNC